tara:strand:+ start:2704 stop:3081 length:378 start_codon:yes stop_codon:yes gene_type:complete
MNKTEQHKKAILEALEKSLGVVTTACKQSDVGRTQFYQWLKDDEEFKKQVDDISNITLDFAESQLHKQIMDGNTTATIFYLKTKGKNRGYVERSEIQQETTYKSLDINIIDTGIPLASNEKDIFD